MSTLLPKQSTDDVSDRSSYQRRAPLRSRNLLVGKTFVTKVPFALKSMPDEDLFLFNEYDENQYELNPSEGQMCIKLPLNIKFKIVAIEDEEVTRWRPSCDRQLMQEIKDIRTIITIEMDDICCDQITTIIEAMDVKSADLTKYYKSTENMYLDAWPYPYYHSTPKTTQNLE